MPNVIANLAEGASKGLFSGIGSLVKDIRVAITGKDPEKLAELDAKLLELEAASQMAQAEINKIDAASNDAFQRRWRPYIGWVCGVGLTIQYLVFPLANMVTPMPKYDFSELINLVIAMLGLGALRTYEKTR